jgi:hypothetical protein
LAVFGARVGKACCFYEFTDNAVALAVMRSMNPSTSMLQELMRWRMRLLGRLRARSAPERVSTFNNAWADDLSRGRMERVVEEAEGFGLKVVVMSVEDALVEGVACVRDAE